MRIACMLLAIFGCLSVAGGQSLWETSQPVTAPRSGFHPEDVVRQVRPARPGPSAGRGPAVLTGEFLIDTSSTLGPALGSQGLPALAFDGVNFLVVWEDYRSDSLGDIYGARVTPQGVVLDSTGIVISRATNDQYDPAVGFDGVNFLVVWEDYRSDSLGDIYGARVTPQGMVLDSAGIVISQAANNQAYPTVGFDGADFLVAWGDYRSGSSWDIYGARVTPQGTVLDSAGIVISQAVDTQRWSAVGFDGANFIAVWQDCRSDYWGDIYGARVTPAGAVLDSTGIAISTEESYQLCPALAFDGANFLVTWHDYRSGSDLDIYGTRVTPQGTVLDSASFAISQGASSQYSPAVGFDGTNFLVAWHDYRSGVYSDIYGARVTPAGAVLDSTGIAMSTAESYQLYPALAFDGANFLVVWQDFRSDLDIYGARVTPQGTVLDSAGLVISVLRVAEAQYLPSLSFDGTNFLVAWQDYRSGISWDIYGARVTPEGTVLDPAGFAISQGANNQYSPAVGFDGTNFLVAWQDFRSDSLGDICGARVTPQGTVLDSAGIVISHAAAPQWWPAIGFDGMNFLVAWHDYRSGINWDIYGARVTPAGAVLDSTGIAISTAESYQLYPALAFDGTNFLAVWLDFRSDSLGDIYGARVTPAGAVLDSTGIAISTAESYQLYPALAFDGTNFLVVWQDFRSDSLGDIYGARVTPQGTVLDSAGIIVSQAADDQALPAVAFDGADFLVAWRDFRSDSLGDIHGARVTPGGTVFDGGSIVSQQAGQTYPKLCCGNGSQMLLVYQGWADTVGGKVYNTDRIWGKVDPNPGIAQPTESEVRMTNGGATVVRGVLFLAARASSSASCLLDVSGRKVLDLHPGANDVRSLSPGVYFAREAQAQAQAVRKVVVTR